MSYEHVFDELQISTDPFALCELHGACDLGLGGESAATLHYILAGAGDITVRGRAPIPVEAGSLVMIPALQSHRLRSVGAGGEPLPECRPAALNLARVLTGADEGTGGARLTALCAHVSVGLRGASDLIDLVRAPLVERVAPGRPLDGALQALIREISQPRLGSRAMVRALLTQCMIEMLRRRLEARDGSMHWMAALKDPSVWNALREMLDSPGAPHTVESLAASAGMSRSGFAKRFSDAYGSGPMELLRDLRMRLAGALLHETDLPVKRIAEMAGFTSRSAFSRMFESRTGQSPREFRAARPAP